MSIGRFVFCRCSTSEMKLLPSFTQLGTTARACLEPNQCGKVLAVFSKAIYLLMDSGELFWMTTTDIPMHRRCAQISAPLPGLVTGSPFHVQDHHLTIDPDFIFEIEDALLWNAPRLDSNHVLEITELPARIHSFFCSLNYSQAKGFGNFIPHILSLAQNESINPSSESTGPILQFSQPLVLDTVCARLDHQPLRVLSNTEALIGLGAGLTPSGDDFVGGLLFALKILRTSYPTLPFADFEIPIDSYRSRTHLISFTLLKDLKDGHAIAPLHSILNGLFSGESPEKLSPYISQLTQVGHSTGWDLLAGLLTGLLVTVQSNDFISSFQMIQRLEA